MRSHVKAAKLNSYRSAPSLPRLIRVVANYFLSGFIANYFFRATARALRNVARDATDLPILSPVREKNRTNGSGQACCRRSRHFSVDQIDGVGEHRSNWRQGGAEPVSVAMGCQTNGVTGRKCLCPTKYPTIHRANSGACWQGARLANMSLMHGSGPCSSPRSSLPMPPAENAHVVWARRHWEAPGVANVKTQKRKTIQFIRGVSI